VSSVDSATMTYIMCGEEHFWSMVYHHDDYKVPGLHTELTSGDWPTTGLVPDTLCSGYMQGTVLN
jgi:hypothetical protein